MDMFLEKRENVSSQAYKLYITVYMELAECNMDIKLNASKIIIAPYVMDVFMTKNISVNRSGRKKLLDSNSFVLGEPPSPNRSIPIILN